MTHAHITRRRLASMLLASAALAPAWRGARAAGLPTPKDKPILTVSGAISVTNTPEAAVFDRAMLEALGMDQITTSTPWTSGTTRFEGVRLEALMRTIGAAGDTVAAHALNDFTTRIPISDFKRFNTILALKRDGEYMVVRDKGPLFIVYPYDSDPVLKQQTYYSRSAWQVARLVVE